MLIEIILTLIVAGVFFGIGRLNRTPHLKRVENKDRKFGAARQYYIATMRDEGGTAHRYAFTDTEIHTATKRAYGNAEDWE